MSSDRNPIVHSRGKTPREWLPVLPWDLIYALAAVFLVALIALFALAVRSLFSLF
jgi:hypothetical protein